MFGRIEYCKKINLCKLIVNMFLFFLFLFYINYEFYYFFSIPSQTLKTIWTICFFKFSIENWVSAPYFKIFEYSRLCWQYYNIPFPFGIPARATLCYPLSHVWEVSACISFYGTRSLLPAKPCRPKRISCAKAIVQMVRGHNKGADDPLQNIIYLCEGHTLKKASGQLWGNSGQHFQY